MLLRLSPLAAECDADECCDLQDAELALSARRQSLVEDEEVVSNNISLGHAPAAGMSGGMDSVMQDAPQVWPSKPDICCWIVCLPAASRVEACSAILARPHLAACKTVLLWSCSLSS